MTISSTPILPVAIIGAGPIGLAAAAHLVSRGIPIEVFEAGDRIAANLESYRHVQLFSPWTYNIDATAATLLAKEPGWELPPGDVLPTGGQVVDQFLLPLSRLPGIAPHLHVNARVLAVSREGYDKVKTKGREDAPFVLRVQTAGGIEEIHARAVIDASGTWSQPGPLGGNGLPALGEMENTQQIAYGMPDIAGQERANFLGKKVLVVGSGHSAVGNLLALAELAEQDSSTHIVWAVRGNDISKVFGGGEADGLPARGVLGLRLRKLIDEGRLEVRKGFNIRAITRCVDKLSVEPADVRLPNIYCVDRIVGATGARPDHSLSRELRTQHDPWLESTVQLAPLIDPNEHSCGSVRPHGHRELAHPEPGFYAIGAKSYGRAPNFLMATGFEQARSVVAALAGDMEAADAVHLELPQTGVCSSRLPGEDTPGAGTCCGPTIAAPGGAAACCGPAPAPAAKAAASCCASAKSVATQPLARGCCG
jgi:hypothetical protein